MAPNSQPNNERLNPASGIHRVSYLVSSREISWTVSAEVEPGMTPTQTTTGQLAVDHAFTGSYAARFRPSDPPESQYCPCGALWRDPPHLTLLCPRFAFTRRNLGIATYQRTLPFKAFFSHKKHAHLLLRLIAETSLATRPEDGPPLYIPPEPD